MDRFIFNRKLEHIRIVLEEEVSFPDQCRDIYNNISLIHQAFPRMNLEDIDLSMKFLGYELSAPLLITGMTGGHERLVKINKKLAELAEKYKIAIGVGSQRPLLVKPNEPGVLQSYLIVRKTARDVPVIGNIGANSLQDYNVDEIIDLVDKIDADALAIHLNPAQEVIQPEGDTRFNEKILDKINKLLDKIHVPVIIKEVGNGLSMETVKLFRSMGIRYFDVAGACGTNWILVEKYRNRDYFKSMIADKLASWGIPTPLSVIEARSTAPDSYIIASGGVWDGIRAVKNLVLGANMAGFARPVLVKLFEGFDKADQFIKLFIEEMKILLFLIGAKNIYELHSKPVILGKIILDYMSQRGIDYKLYDKARRSITYE